MPKGVERGNREAKKPKKDKPREVSSYKATELVSSTPGAFKQAAQSEKKPR